MNIICYGDSNTYGWDPSYFSGNHYAHPWPERMAQITGNKVVNCGEPGRVLPFRKEYLEWFCRDVRANAPDLLVIMLGTNDLFYASESTADAVAARMKEMICCAIQNQLAEKILLLSCPHVLLMDSRVMAVLEEISERYRRIAEEEGIGFADAFRWDIPLAFDGVHFTEDGHRVFAEKISSVITEKYQTTGV